ncbi:MAG TPA: hypothetical protein VFN61_12970 [Acidimicrobiales bacterium]|nr:hypothetical protein [Acidimicrobiales bacterium]
MGLIVAALSILLGIHDPSGLLAVAVIAGLVGGISTLLMRTPKEERVAPLVMTVDDTEVVFKRAGKTTDRVERRQVALAVVVQGSRAMLGIELYDDARRSLGYWSIDRPTALTHWYVRAFRRHGWPWMIDRPVLYFIPGHGLSHDAPRWAKELRRG